MLKFSFSKALMVVDSTVADELDLRLPRDGLKVWV